MPFGAADFDTVPELRSRPDLVQTAHGAVGEIPESEHYPDPFSRSSSDRKNPRHVLNSSGVGRFCGGAHRTAAVTYAPERCSPSVRATLCG